MKESIIREKSYAFALRVIMLARWLRAQREFEIGGQVLRAGTSIGANVEEALAAVSRADFVAKMAISSKEARETHYWLRLLRDSETVPTARISPLLEESLELLRILTAIVKTGQLKTKN
jgi:four helix bundle protein